MRPAEGLIDLILMHYLFVAGEAGQGGSRGRASMSNSSMKSGAEPEVVFSASLPAAYHGRPEDDWTLEAQHASLIIGGQVRVSRPDLCWKPKQRPVSLGMSHLYGESPCCMHLNYRYR